MRLWKLHQIAEQHGSAALRQVPRLAGTETDWGMSLDEMQYSSCHTSVIIYSLVT